MIITGNDEISDKDQKNKSYYQKKKLQKMNKNTMLKLKTLKQIMNRKLKK